MGRKSRLRRFDEKVAYHAAVKEFKDIMKPDPETGENCVSISKIALWYLDQRRTIESLKDKIENQKYHIKKLEHQKKYYKSTNRDIDLIDVLRSLNCGIDPLDVLDELWDRANPSFFRRKVVK